MTSNKIKGDEYEIFIKKYIINELNKEAYLWKEIPEKILIDAKLIHSHNENRIKRKNCLIDVGVDILQIDNNNYTLVQCKNGYNKGIRIEDLAGFYMMMFNHSHMNGNVYYTSKLSIHIRENAVNQQIQYIKKIMEIKEEVQINFKPYDYQIEASNKIIKYLEQNDKAILSLPCGCGKTFTSYLVSLKFDKILIISPLKEFAKQNMNKFIEYGNKNKYLLIDSDGTRDIDEIDKFINNNSEHLISSTYKSVDIIIKLNLENYLIIIDEFHNLSKNNVYNEDDNFYKLLNTNNKFLLMSATPRIYEIENDEYDIYLGEVIYNIKFNEAIENKYICDYKIWLPSIHEDNTELINEININDIDNELKTKCMFLFKCLLYNGSKKCIIYCQDINNLNNIRDTIIKLNYYYVVDLNIQEITSDTTFKNREKILNDFETSNKIELLLSIRILDECIDIPSCDSIYITYPSESKIRTIQRLCRCIRIDKNNKYKIGNIFIWCNEYDSILNTLSGIKEYDVLFKNKISILETNFMNKKEIDEKVIEDKKLIEKYVLDIKEFKQYSWNEKLEQVKKYINKNKKRPNSADKNNKIKQLGNWLSIQQKNYKNNLQSMKDENIKKDYELFLEKYKEYLLNNKEVWYDTLEKLKKYIDENKKSPSNIDKDKNIKNLGQWLSQQKNNYIKIKDIMKQVEIYNEYNKFINDEKYKEYFKSNIQIFIDTLNQVKKYIDENKKRPSSEDTNPEIKQLGSWLLRQQQNYKNNDGNMKQDNIKIEWELFINKYSEYFLNKNEIWHLKKNKLEEYIFITNKLPSILDKNTENKNLSQWLSQQLKHNKQQKIYFLNNYKKDWDIFINKYKHLFIK